MERGRRRGPDRGPRKRRKGKIAGSKAEAAVKECLLNGGTLEEASRLVTRINGKRTSKMSVARYYRRLIEAAERTQMVEGLARALAGKMTAASARNAGAMARQMLLARALEAAARLPEGAMNRLPPDRLALLLCRLERSAAEADRHRWEAFKSRWTDNDSRKNDLGEREDDVGEEGANPSTALLSAALRRLMSRAGAPGGPAGPGGTEEADGEPEETDGGEDEDGEEEREAEAP